MWTWKGAAAMGKWPALFLCFAICNAAVATTVEWRFPRTASCHEGIPFADGVTGVLVWGGGSTVNLTVGRSDLWDHRGGYPWTSEQSYSNIVALVQANDVARLGSLFVHEVPKGWCPAGIGTTDRYNPYMLPLGRVTLEFRGAVVKSGALDTATGLGRLVMDDGRVVSLAMSTQSRLFAALLPAGLECVTRIVPATDFPVYDRILKGRGFERAKKDAHGFVWNLPADAPVFLETHARPEGECTAFFLRTSREPPAKPLAAEAASFAGVRGESEAYWRRFWREGARVTVPDPVVQQMFDLGMYKFGAMTDPDGVAAGLQGPWLEDDRLVPWNGDYHFNINVQECYSPAYRGGHFRNLMPLFRMVLSWRERLRDNARKFVMVDDGYVLPHSVDDRGVCIGGFWTGTIDHASTAWIAALMFRYVRYSGDVAFLRNDAYDFMKGAMNVYLAMMEERGGKLSIPLAPSPEWGAADARKAVGRDPSFQLAAAHRLARDLVAAAGMLGERPDGRWLDVERRLPAYTSGPGGIQLFEGQPFAASHRHHSHLAGLYPFDTVSMSSDCDGQVARDSYRTWVYKGPGEWSGWCVPWASILHVHMGSAHAAVAALHDWKTFFNNPGHGSLHDAFHEGYTVFTGRPLIMQMDGQCAAVTAVMEMMAVMDGQCAAVTAVMEMMAHEIDGRTEFFRGCPDDWREVSFENLALSDGTRVNGRRVDGHVVVEKAR